MPLALARLADDKSLVGLFCVDDPTELADAVEQYAAPCEVEYTLVASGAVVLAGACGQIRDALRDVLEDPGTQWRSLDPMCTHPESQIEAILSTPQGRREYARQFRAALAQRLGSLTTN